MNSSSLTNDGGISEAGSAYSPSYSSSSNQQHTDSYTHDDPPTNCHPSQHQEVASQAYTNQNYQQPYNHASTSTSFAAVQIKSNPYPESNVTQNQPQPQSKPAPFQNQADVQAKYHSMNPPSVPGSASASASATLAPVQALFQGVWAETQNQVARTHAHYEQLIAKERANTAEQLQNANAKVNGANVEAQRFLMLYESSQQQNNKLLAEIAELRNEVAKVRRMTGREKGALETTNRTLVKVMQSQEEEMEKLKNEWNVGQAVRVKLHAENRRLASELEEVKDKLAKIERSFDQKVRGDFEVRLAKVFGDEQRRKLKHHNKLPLQEQIAVVKMEDGDPPIKIEDK